MQYNLSVFLYRDNGPLKNIQMKKISIEIQCVHREVKFSFHSFTKMPKLYEFQFFFSCLQLNGSIRPVPPPRDHLRMEKDGRMVNRAPAPQVPDRNPALQTHQIAQIVDATPEQLDSIRKYQVQ